MLESKIFTSEKILFQIESWKKSGKKIVFTNGCFDILHEGHVRYLYEAKSLGDVLILGLNSDTSVKRAKGPHRPINSQNSRAIVLAGLESVDAIIIFEEDTPYDLISMILPDVLVKGGDWKPEQIIGSDIVVSNGGTVHSLNFYQGHSTTLIEQKLKTSN